MPSRTSHIGSTLAVLTIVSASPAPAQTARTSRRPEAVQNRAHVLNRWENVAALASGIKLRVALADGTRSAGALLSVSPDHVVIQVEGGAGSVTWRRDQVARVEQRRGPRVRSGAGWGALVGVLVGAIALGTIEPKDAVTDGVLHWHEIPVLATGTAIGMGTGSVINVARRRWVVVYQNPMIGPWTRAPGCTKPRSS